MLKRKTILLFPLLTFFSCEKEPGPISTGILQITAIIMDGISLLDEEPIVSVNSTISISFNSAVATESVNSFQILNNQGNELSVEISFLDNNKLVSIIPSSDLAEGQDYILEIKDDLKGENGESFPGFTVEFKTKTPPLVLNLVSYNDQELQRHIKNLDIPLDVEFVMEFSEDVPLEVLNDNIFLVGDKNYSFDINKEDDNKYKLSPNENLKDFSKISLLFSSSLGTDQGKDFETISFQLYTVIDSIPKFSVIPDEELLTLIQKQTFKYFWDFGHPVSGLARERNSNSGLVTIGGSGFGIMSVIVGIERGFISREEGIARWEKILNFLNSADRFHGVWPHWRDGATGKTRPFSEKDNGGDLVETSFLIQGLLTVRQYLNPEESREAEMIELINKLWEEVEWDWYRKNDENVLYWHWSPQFQWEMNLPIRGHNETQIVYILAASSPTHSIPKEVYVQGYARNGGIQNGNSFYGIDLPLGQNRGGPLFFTHYSYLGMDPRNLSDDFANYWEQNTNHSRINFEYCVDNPLNFVGYSENCWGLTASDNHSGYSAHSPNNDKGVITPTAAISSLPYTPEESMNAIKFFYYTIGDRLWGEYGFFDAFNPTENWYASSYLAIDQGPIILMIENYRTGLLWDLFMSTPEIQNGLEKLDFNF